MATTVFQDTFTEGGADVNLASHTPNVGTGWTEAEDTVTDFLEVESSTDDLRPNSGHATGRMVYTATPSPALGGADYDVLFTMNTVVSDEPNGVVARWQDASNTYFAELWPTGSPTSYTMAIYKKVSGSVTLLDSDTTALSAGDDFVFELRGTALKLYQNGVERCAATDGDISGTGAGGVYWGDLAGAGGITANNRLDDFLIVDQNTGGGGGGGNPWYYYAQQ